MTVSDFREPCLDCVHREVCPIKHPELAKGNPETLQSCEKLDKYSEYLRSKSI